MMYPRYTNHDTKITCHKQMCTFIQRHTLQVQCIPTVMCIISSVYLTTQEAYLIYNPKYRVSPLDIHKLNIL